MRRGTTVLSPAPSISAVTHSAGGIWEGARTCRILHVLRVRGVVFHLGACRAPVSNSRAVREAEEGLRLWSSSLLAAASAASAAATASPARLMMTAATAAGDGRRGCRCGSVRCGCCCGCGLEGCVLLPEGRKFCRRRYRMHGLGVSRRCQ